MSDISYEKREEYVKELDLFVESSMNELSSIISELGWSMESINENTEQMVVCPFFSSHRIPLKSLEPHLERCQWKAEGYNEYDKPFSESQKSNQNNSSSITFDEELQSKVLKEAKLQNPNLNIGLGEQLIPRTSDRLFSDFTSTERRVLYDYVLSHTVKPEIGRDITDLNKEKNEDNEFNTNETSFLEQIAQERNLKRRRTRHRGVHTNKKSHTEILREVINQQMELYMEYVSKKKGETSKKHEFRKDFCQINTDSLEYANRKPKLSKEYENDYEKDDKYHRSEHKLKHKHRSRSRSKHKKKNKHRSRDRQEKKKKRSRSREKKSKYKDHKDHKGKKRRSRS